MNGLSRIPEFHLNVQDVLWLYCTNTCATTRDRQCNGYDVGILRMQFITEDRWTDNPGIKSASEMFHGCTSLHTISHSLDFSNVESQIDTTFTTCRNLQNVRFSGTINVDIYMNGCPKLTVDSLLSLLNALADGVTDKTCKIGSTYLAKLTEEQKAIAIDKGWTLA